ncbi:two-component system OmpR family response regulator [Rhodothalassium salexigens DSM 2132]|uniref:Regulatory protein VirG n=1 Tax=Rhodothalassium salexigens DSM 2132 TaxID=1188247 RepID=A0A4R2PVI6_RHOSA|nr:response regulator transcription factor [Rhodothalassium salexigens]MBB4210050.1 DNA-binding response OmpR family regulator [Rhodothalassium salexigens DSM 2132]MBK1637580.1 hypothetical protein [Rhodothalassium salexigens DSM 2132]TCP38215.1 two-component system OmpR family response regulator [Rhodothalassium salexigens DSM 2132]
MAANRAQRILVVDDDDRLCRLIADYLGDEGYRVDVARDAAAMWQALDEADYHLITLDLALPDEDGLSVARELGRRAQTPIIIVSGKGDVVDRVAGLEVGADDYIAKPFHMREILARIRAVLRRSAPTSAPDGPAEVEAPARGRRLRFDQWELDLDLHELQAADGLQVGLTAIEYDLLLAFLNRPQRVLTRDQLMDLTRGATWEPYDRTIDSLVARLRKKLSAKSAAHDLIRTVRGTGYVFNGLVQRIGRPVEPSAGRP